MKPNFEVEGITFEIVFQHEPRLSCLEQCSNFLKRYYSLWSNVTAQKYLHCSNLVRNIIRKIFITICFLTITSIFFLSFLRKFSLQYKTFLDPQSRENPRGTVEHAYIHIKFFSVQSDHADTRIPQSVQRYQLPLVNICLINPDLRH